jgi:Rrf2 family nitric oxide-sensitive transcriptional repressor
MDKRPRHGQHPRMKLTRYTDYALRVLMYLAVHADRRCSIREIAEAYGISENHLMKVVQSLGGLGFVATIRGRGGGLHLGRDPAGIRLGDVVRATEHDLAPADCEGCTLAGACRLESVFDRAVRAFLEVLDECTLAEVVADRRLRALLPVPIAAQPN